MVLNHVFVSGNLKYASAFSMKQYTSVHDMYNTVLYSMLNILQLIG